MRNFSKRMNFFTSLFVKVGVLTDEEKLQILKSMQKDNKKTMISK